MAEQHTPGAMRAAKKIAIHLDRFMPEQNLEPIAAIIDQETGLPEITAERDRLLTEKAKLVVILGGIKREAAKTVALVSEIPGNQGDRLAARTIWIRNEAQRALAKAEPS